MERSPLQLMSRMASVVKGQYQATKQMDDVVEPNAGEKAATLPAPLETTTLEMKKDPKDSPPTR